MAAPKPGSFCVYTNLSTSIDEAVAILNEGLPGPTYGDQWYPSPSNDSFRNAPASAIVAHHRTHADPFNTQYFVIIDKPDCTTHGVLGVNLDHEGFIDAARMKPDWAGSALPSVEVGNSDWMEATVSGAVVKSDRKYATYLCFDPSEADGGRIDVVRALNEGLDGRKAGFADHCQAANETMEEAIAKGHMAIAHAHNFHEKLFLVADDKDWNEYGALMMRIGDDWGVDTCRKPIDVALEILGWVDAGLYTWEEGKAWDEEKQDE